jgi:hypothetical protein
MRSLPAYGTVLALYVASAGGAHCAWPAEREVDGAAGESRPARLVPWARGGRRGPRRPCRARAMGDPGVRRGW